MPQSHTDRNLLFGILALQMDFIDRDALVAAMNSWVLEKSKPLGQILVGSGVLSASDRDLLEPIVDRHVQMHGSDPEKSLAILNSIGDVSRDLKRITDPDVQCSLDHIVREHEAEERTGIPGNDDSEIDPYATRSVSLGQRTLPAQRFRVLRRHAKGGLGEVFVAHDEELPRQVALKQIQSHHADSSDARTRFIQEAEITGGLEHPGIVPVYGLGRYADGRPFYATRFVHGDDLAAEIKRFHTSSAEGAGNGSLVGERAVEFRKLIARFIDVCDAMEYAHSRGVLHRDLKPGNC